LNRAPKAVLSSSACANEVVLLGDFLQGTRFDLGGSVLLPPRGDECRHLLRLLVRLGEELSLVTRASRADPEVLDDPADDLAPTTRTTLAPASPRAVPASNPTAG
jgi:hypothetical protein